MTWNKNLTNLNYVLADLYPHPYQADRLVDAAGIPLRMISRFPSAIDDWHEILREADRRQKVADLVRVVREDYPDNPYLIQAEKGELTQVMGPVIGVDLPWSKEEPVDNLEKILGRQSTLLPISFLEIGLQRAKAIARVCRVDGALASGFLTKGEVFVTNHHVFHNQTEAKSSIIQFNYQKNPDGLDLPPDNYALDPEACFATSKEDDWTLVKVKGKPSEKWGSIELERIVINEGDFVNIIQHPGGDRKQIALYHNLVVYADDKRIQYLTDTLPGSSGSPVFNSQWQVVALHHSGGWLQEPGVKQTYYRNEGIHVNCLIDGMNALGVPPDCRG